MTILRAVKDKFNPFVQINKKMFEDSNLSLKAKGLIGYCLSKKDYWVFYVEAMAKELKEGETAIYNAIKECVEQGYAIRFQMRKSNGDFDRWETIVSDSKETIAQLKQDPEFKKIFTEPGFAEPRVADAQNQGLTTMEVSNTLSSYISPSNNNSKKENVAVYDCLSGFADADVSLQEKEWITKTYDEETVKHAVAYTNHPETKILTTKLKTLKWACKTKPELPKAKIKTLGRREEFELTYKNGGIYNSAECWIDDNGFAFERGRTHKSLKWNEFNYEEKLKEILEFVNKRC